MKVIALFALFALCSGSVTVQQDKTITKVVKLLQNMLDKSVKEGDAERKIFAKFKCYCDTSEAEKNDSIDNGKEQISLLESKIEEIQGDTGGLSSEVADLKAKMADNVAARKEAQNLRDKENKAFKAEKADLKQGIDQMRRAIETLEKVGADQTKSAGADTKQFMAKSSLLSVQSEVQHALNAASAIMTDEQQSAATAFLQGPFTGTYTSQSAVVMGIIKNMRDTFEKNLADAIRTEADALKAHNKFMKLKKEAHKEMSDSYDEKQKALGGNDGDLGTKKKQLSDAQKQLASDEEFLSKLIPMCKDKTEAYNNRKMLRANEEAAIAEAISILNSDAAFATFGTTSATSTGATGLFLQLRSTHRHVSGNTQVRKTAQNVLQKAAAEAHSARLTKVASLLQAENPFDEVLGEIDNMLELIKEEEKADQDKLDWCNKERKDNNAELKKKNKEILALEKEIDRLEGVIGDPKTGLKKQIADTEQDLEDYTAAMTKLTKQRTEENLDYQQDVKNLVAAQIILKKAIKVLKTYYDDMEKQMKDGLNAFVQTKKAKREDPNAPDAALDDDYKGQSGQGNAVLKMLNFINDETNKEEMKAHSDEEKAQADYEDDMTDFKDKEAKAEKRLGNLQESLADNERDLLQAQEDHKATTEDRDGVKDYLAKIKPGCDFITENFKQRQANRKTESAALNKAIKLIKGTPAYKSAVSAATSESYGDCREPCDKDKDHVDCKACMADVTKPAYCAGHKGTKGC